MALFRRKKSQQESSEHSALELPGAPVDDASGRRSMDDHREFLLSLVKPLQPFGLSIGDALGLELCEDVPAPVDVPHLTTAVIDGFALDSAVTTRAGNPYPVTLQVDRRPPSPVVQGTAVVVRSGEVLPAGVDCVVPAESLDEDGQVSLSAPVRAWSGCRLAGSDFAAGDAILAGGRILHPATVGLLADSGVDKVLARPRPRVVVLGTGGSRLSSDGLPLPDVTAHLIAAAATEAGAHVWRVEADGTDREELREAITDQLIRADLLLVTADPAFSAGPDPASELLPELGATDFCQVAMEPGGTQGFGLVGPDLVAVMVLPPGPGAALVSFHAFAAPLLRKMGGTIVSAGQQVVAEAADILADPDVPVRFVPVNLRVRDGRTIATRAGRGDARELVDLAGADALAVIPAGEGVDISDTVTCWPIEQN
ncbi:gephyrin-like molybdotransferase Glp [Acidipropionibacterium jensenii]|uniref:gephyrin-like molybdotransferase Glp n=1 Tax=Acidipropionibacterium jensenii TaxID=1749 RepID=UPI00214BAF66|nr:gephyrin-like molybdotransferase Glp [Acidipropionibacterium jensenii]